eukprot:scaffold31070_cov46-Attheya_sp.AAC.3
MKCGSSYMQNYIFGNKEFFHQNENGEICDLTNNDPETLLSRFNNNNNTPHVQHQFIKCPKDLESEFALPLYEKYFPDIKFIVNVRHPVKWFQSFYNFRIRRGFDMLPIEELIGPCMPNSPYIGTPHDGSSSRFLTKTHNVCTDRTKFHHALSRLGKTPMNTRAEEKMLDHKMSIHSLSDAKVFILDVEQLGDENATLANKVLWDIHSYLELEHDLPPIKPKESKHAEENKEEINICDSKYKFVREILIEIGAEASNWIQNYFLQSPDVYVSSRDHFIDIINQWQYDPCDTKGKEG